MNNEYLVYYLHYLQEDVRTVNSFDIDSWSEMNKLPIDAKIFIELAEKEGNIMSLQGLQYALNSEEFNMFDNYVFITNKY